MTDSTMSGISESTRLADWIETEELRSNHAAADAELKSRLGYRLEEINGVWCSLCTSEPSILLNRAIGLGVNQPATRETIHAITQLYRDAGIREYFLHVLPEVSSDECRRWLEAAGLKKDRGWMKFVRGTEAPEMKPVDFSIREIGAEHAEDFARIVTPCFDLEPDSIPLVAGIVRIPEYHLYMTFDGDTPAGTGALYVKDKVGYVDWGATHQDFRRRGSQGALLRHRINAAIDMGCEMIVTATGEEVPGDPQHSYRNIMRYGFRETAVRENWSPA